jgi:hypothetical protein
MSKSEKKRARKATKPGQTASRSGVYEITGPRGGIADEVIVGRGQPLPPLPKAARRFALRTKSGSYIIASPAKSANSVAIWSKAFKKK